MLKKSITVAFDRTGTVPMGLEQIDLMVNDVFAEFPGLNEVDIKKALRNGGMGLYGKTYKLTTQEICIWIRQYIKENVPAKYKAPWQ